MDEGVRFQVPIRSAEINFSVPVDEDLGEFMPVVQAQRVVKLECGPDESWPKDVKRGRTVDLNLNVNGQTHTFHGRVRSKRLRVVYLEGSFHG